MTTISKLTRTERERQVQQLARRLVAEAGSGRRRRWRITQLLAAYKIGQALNEVMTPWWWNLEIHKIDMLFPWDENVVNTFAEDLQRIGYGEDYPPVILFEDKVLDGKLRLEAARRVYGYTNVTPRFEFFDGHVKDALEYAIQLNGQRLYFSARQQAALLVEMGVR